MDCCQVEGIEEFMDAGVAARELKSYREKGPAKTTAILLEALKREGVENTVLLDIGGGVGAIQHELLKSGANAAVCVDASSAYLEAAREEAERQGHVDKLLQLHGDFVQVADQVDPADVVTLDRVICCYDDMKSLVELSAERARKLYGVVYPRDHLLVQALTWLENIYYRMRAIQFRAFAHPVAAIEEAIRGAGLRPVFTEETILWRVQVYRRSIPS